MSIIPYAVFLMGLLQGTKEMMCERVLYSHWRPFCSSGYLALFSADVTECLQEEMLKRTEVNLTKSSIYNWVAVSSWFYSAIHGGKLENTSRSAGGTLTQKTWEAMKGLHLSQEN